MTKAPSTRVMEIFSEAASRPAAECAAYLDGACGDDDELRSEVESLLSTSEQASGFLCAATAGGAEVKLLEAAALEDERSIEKTGAIGGRYNIIERLGEGGWGVVYSARQIHPIRREVALKIVKLGTDSRSIIARFESERQSLAMMDHPNIARIFDAGTTDDGRPCFAMELVRGTPITDYCDAQRLSVPRRLELFATVCQAVQHAHQKGIIHRDLKPSNVLVSSVDGVATPKVIDFGIAKAVGSVGPDAERSGELRYFLGTPQYMSPEQAAGGDGDVDTRSDIYSLGVLLYELLVGATPRDPRTLREMSCEQTRELIAQQEPPAPAARLTTLGGSLQHVARCRGVDARRLRRIVSGDLQWIAGRAMARERSQRYETAGALCEDVKRYLADEPVLAAPPDSLYRARKFARRHRQGLLAVCSLVLAVLLGLAGTTFGLIRAQRDRRAAQTALAEAQQLSNFLSGMLSSANPDRAHGQQLLVRDLLDRSSHELDQGSLKDQPLVEASVHFTLGSSYESLGLFPEADTHLRKSLEIRERILGDDNRDTARSMASLAWLLHDKNDMTGAEQLARRALAIQERILGEHHREFISTLITLGDLRRCQNDCPGAIAIEKRAIALSDTIPSGRDLRAVALTNLAVAQMLAGHMKDAEPLVREALAIDRQLHGDLYRNVPRNLGNLAVILNSRGDYKGAIDLLEQAIALERQMLPRDHPDIAWNLRTLGNAKRRQGDLSGAEKDLREAMEMDQRVYGADHAIMPQFMEDLAAVLEKEGKTQEAAALRRQLVEVRLTEAQEALAAHPDSFHHGTLAEWEMRYSDFNDAKLELAKALSLEPRKRHWIVDQGCLCLFLGDQSGYRAACRRVLDNQVDIAHATGAGDALELCLLTPPAEADQARLAELAQLAGKQKPVPTSVEFQLCLFDLRQGNFPRAMEMLEPVRSHNPSTTDRIKATFCLALCFKQEGRIPEATAALQSAEADFQRLPKVGEEDLGPEVINLLITHILRREVRAAFGLPSDGKSLELTP